MGNETNDFPCLGYIALVAMFLSVGIKINRTVPPKVLVDWEGILRPTPRDFIDTIKVRARVEL